MASEVYPRDAGKVLFISYILTPGSMQAGELNLRIALENLGDGRDNSLNTGRLAGSLIQWIGSPYVQMNYDPMIFAEHAYAVDSG
jgi:hypothetical protein